MKQTKRKGILEFDLSDYYEKESFKNAIDADTLRSKIETMYDKVFRKYIKYGERIENKDLSKRDKVVIETIMNELLIHFDKKDDL